MDHPVLGLSPTLQDVQKYVGEVVKYRGFDNQTVKDELLMLCEEVGELAKAIRKQSGIKMATDSHDSKVNHEIADVLWLLACVSNRLGIDMEEALRQKEEHNKTRTWK